MKTHFPSTATETSLFGTIVVDTLSIRTAPRSSTITRPNEWENLAANPEYAQIKNRLAAAIPEERAAPAGRAK